MQPLIQEIIDIAQSKDEKIRKDAIMILCEITCLCYESRSYQKRIEQFHFIPERYQLLFVFDDEYGQIANFLSRLFIDDYTECAKEIPFYLGKIHHQDALEPLLDIMIEAPERLDEEWIGFQFILAFSKLLSCYKAWSKKNIKNILKAKSPVPFFKRWSISPDSDTAEAGRSWLRILKDDYKITK
jgi:hypothetical protein